MMAVRIDRVHRKLHRPVYGTDADKPARLQIVGDQKSRRQQNTDTLQDGSSQCSAAVGDQVAGDLQGCRCAIPVDEAPLILVGIKRRAHTMVTRKPLALAVALGVAAAVASVAARLWRPRNGLR